MLSVTDAFARIRAELPTMEPERVPLTSAAGRILAEPIVATRPLPPHDNSAMDGFAVRAADLPGTLPVAGTVAAGDPPTAVLTPGTALRIMTGAPLPSGADTIVMRENANSTGEWVTIVRSEQPGRDVRRSGEDVSPGEQVLVPGTMIGPGEIGLLAALGCAQVPVAKRPTVAILSSGDELVEVEAELQPGQIVNSNAYALAAQVREAGAEPISIGIARDDLDSLAAKLTEGLRYDMLVTSGGVSVGDFDYIKPAFDRVGVPLAFWKVAMKPGKPLAFGTAPNGTPVFGLPGNPVSSMVVFELFARRALRIMQGATDVDRPRVSVRLNGNYPKKAGRTHFVRAALQRIEDDLIATPNARQGSGMLRSMVGVDALLELAEGLGDVADGTRVPALLLRPV